MATPELVGKLEPCVQYLEGFLSSAKSWGDLANPLDKSVEILRALLSLSSTMPSLNVTNDELHINVSHIFENGIWVIDNIVQFQASYLENSMLEELCSLHHVLEDILPELKTIDVRSCAVKSGFKLDQPSEDHLEDHLELIAKAMENILEALTCFQGAFNFCREASACVQEYSVVWPELKDLIEDIESKTVKTHGQTSDSHFLSIFSKTLDRLFKISTDALRLLFTFPEMEGTEFPVILTLCENVVHIFVYAIGILNYFNQFFLKDSFKLKELLHELSQNMQAVHTCCGEMFELKRNTVAIFENVRDKKCGDIDVLKNSTININDATVSQDLKDAEQTVRDSIEIIYDASVPLNVDNVQCNNMCDTTDNNVDKTQSDPVATNLCPSTSTVSKVTSSPTAFAQSSGNSSSIKNAKSIAKTTTVPETYTLFNFLSESVLRNSLTPKQKKILEETIRKYKCRVKHFFGFKTAESVFLVTCKLCGDTSPLDDIEKHINSILHQLNLSKTCQKNLKACTVISVLLKINPSSSLHSHTLALDFRDINFDILTLNERKVLKKVIMKIKNSSDHYPSYTILTTKTLKFLTICNTCGIGLRSESIKDYNMHENHEFHRNLLGDSGSSGRACTALPEMNSDKWHFLNFPPDTQHKCSLCAIPLSDSTNSFVQHMHSFVHQSKFRDSQFQDSAETKFSNLIGYAHLFCDSLKTNFVSLEVSQKQCVDTLGAKLKDAVNSFSIQRSRDLVQLSFICHTCGWSILWKNALEPEHVKKLQEEDRASSNELQDNNFYEDYPGAERFSSNDRFQNDHFYEDPPPTEELILKRTHDFVNWCNSLVQNLYG